MNTHKKILQFITVLLLIALFFPTVALAHGGKTDQYGGHTDKSTGEYHYHHGYPAHDHYDMDGDGRIDCPYDFDDQTEHNSSTSSSNNSAIHNNQTSPTNFNDVHSSNSVSNPKTSRQRNNTIDPSLLILIISLVAAVINIPLGILMKQKDSKIINCIFSISAFISIPTICILALIFLFLVLPIVRLFEAIKKQHNRNKKL